MNDLPTKRHVVFHGMGPSDLDYDENERSLCGGKNWVLRIVRILGFPSYYCVVWEGLCREIVDKGQSLQNAVSEFSNNSNDIY
jgi:hypothetical protein